ncbi:Protein kinase domain-containing protein [Aspergillus homomorphus CBS 101889]|uniref:EKC/KEOPS complex subunit BUD32 n=1 Tax=Aspergillus homomorphus (strain CBS 101889) TaxID=1450537 RepID=A0A395I8U5_ASPHC|nr:kinase-like protein [Aspergillus homomorphus CBS 101889]RAL14564.1 kinase-like protein [Aspergillus homomorphus CBS 101889]
MTDHFVVRGILGTGTYGVVFLAHKNNEDHLYAIKMENLVTIGTSMQYYAQPTVVGCIGPQPMVAPLFTEEFVDYHYIPVEAYILLLTNESDRFPTLDSVYTHGYYQAIVMDAHVDDEVAESAYDPDAPFAKWNEERFSSCGGHNFVYMKETKLQEYMVCKIASHLLEGIAYLRDMRICHNDLTMSNFVIDKNLNTTLLDVGLFTFALTDDDYWAPDFTYVPGYEGNSTPEVILALLRDIYRDRLKKRTQIQVGVPHDVRKTGLWMLAADIYELLHGYMPWENPEWDGRVSYLSQWKQQGIPRGHEQLRSYEANRRRHRVVNLEIPLRESLSQDCADAMLMMFAKDTKKRPTLPEMESFVWFGQWDYLDPEQFQRPAPYDT